MKPMCEKCIDCKERSITCHSTCEAYLQYVKENEEYKKLVKKEKHFDRYVCEQHSKHKDKEAIRNRNIKGYCNL